MQNRHPESLVNRIREIRKKQKLSYAYIGREFKIPSSTIRNWCYDLKVSKEESMLRSNEYRRQIIQNSEYSVVPKIKNIDVSLAKFYSSLLYGCEGSKYPASNFVAFANSDPLLVLTFLKLLRKSFNLDRNKLYARLQIHSNHDYSVLRKYWSKLLNIAENKFIKPTITIPRGRKHRRLYLGTCTVKYQDYRIQLKLQGIFEAFIQQFSTK
jgi:hypothetical protein